MRSLAVAFAFAGAALVGPSDVLAVAAALVVAMAIVLAARLVGALPSVPARVPVSPAHVHHALPIRQVDPDAPGRPRPRAPGARPSAA